MRKPELGKEYPPKGEEQAIEEINRRIEAFLRKQYEETGDRPAYRTVHAKSPACLQGEFVVLEGIPQKAKVGMFHKGGTYECWIRFSNGSQFIRHDKSTDTRGLAIKVMGVKGKKILEEKIDARTQDFMFLNGKNFPISSVKDFARFTKWFLTKNFLFGYPLSPIIRRWFQMFTLIRNSTQKVLNPLAIPWYSTTPYKWGDAAVKYCLKPQKALSLDGIDTEDPNFMHKAIKETLVNQHVTFDFMLQFQVDPVKMPIENSRKIWSEELSPFVKVGEVTILDQDFSSTGHLDYCEGLAFSTWHSLPEHRPLGGTNRSHKATYLLSSKLRHELNGTTEFEPENLTHYAAYMNGNEGAKKQDE